ncbi:MAG: hypothetical protein PVI28_13520 [Gammaproteobacteria bacterium]
MRKLATAIAAAGLVAVSGSASAWWGPGWDDGYAPYGYTPYAHTPPPLPHAPQATPGVSGDPAETHSFVPPRPFVRPHAFVPPPPSIDDLFRQRERELAAIDQQRAAMRQSMNEQRKAIEHSREAVEQSFEENRKALEQSLEEQRRAMHEYHEQLMRNRSVAWHDPYGLNH